MRPRDLAELLLLAALWGGSFLAMRVAAPDFGPLALVFVRVAGASAVLLPLLRRRGEWPALRTHWRPIALVGLTNSALPFLCFTVAALAINAGLSSIFNATTPLWAALVGWVWLRDRPGRDRLLGLAIGFAGVVWLAMGKASLKPGEHGVSPALAVAACIAAAMLYGFSANFAKRQLTGVPPMALAAGSQLSATAVLALPAAWAWPPQAPPAASWWAAALLAVACTALAYVLYFRLIAHTGPASASSVTFLIPAFAIGWGWMFLGERLSPEMLAGCAVILLGTALATGLQRRPRARHRPV
ncbi:MAG: DMT family transporter [Rubrivivax sp.]|nr:DMT family transporter [Rubrivivax sp.]MDH5339471.1 DMT family transporter [Rubrivivax sp.]